ncbi:Protein of unknown function [Pseudonocardia thermophila]|uniref:YetF C-terminal domain-containing protein n=1 Tax=Pseudonocardia thermophila TaxID=1848 RepID=A0A1M6QZT2_PSETH|nr:YetF domain-containing protein [Pseudonocardia thermophila]SHK25577.1 Protein of unknown function [Pseudonocardia thermophila]
MLDELTSPPTTVGAVVVATVVVFAIVLSVHRLGGPRVRTPLTAADLALATMLGAIAARTTLLDSPTLVTGVVALLVLVLLHRVLRRVRRRAPLVLMSDGVPDPAALRRARLDEDDLRQRLRQAGITRRSDVWRVILEPDGQISVLRAGGDDPWIVADVDRPGARAPRP